MHRNWSDRALLQRPARRAHELRRRRRRGGGRKHWQSLTSRRGGGWVEGGVRRMIFVCEKELHWWGIAHVFARNSCTGNSCTGEERFIYSVFTKDMLDEKGQARNTSTHVTFNALNSTKNSPVVAGFEIPSCSRTGLEKKLSKGYVWPKKGLN